MSRTVLLICFFWLQGLLVCAQELIQHSYYLYKPLSIDAEKEPLGDVLEKISKTGKFYFSYGSSLLPQDSLVSIHVQQTQVKYILDQLLGERFDYRESGNYIIIRPPFQKLSITAENISNDSRRYLISGIVKDERSGEPLRDVSVYEKRLLRSTLTGRDGSFRLKFKGDYASVTLTASKENYRDTSMAFLSDISISPEGYTDTSTAGRGASSLVERIGLGRFLVSSKQKMQSLNIPQFFANSPFQASLTPGLSSHGMMSSQVVNKASLNVLGGYTAGVDGVEVAGLFNVNKGDVKHFQAAGLSNVVGGSVQGVQVGGFVNTVLKRVEGFQAAGLANTVKDSVAGVQVAGIFNGVKRVMDGVQVAGIANYNGRESSGWQTAGIINVSGAGFKGMQVAGVMNFSRRSIDGGQIGLVNYAQRIKGFQIGLLNLADSSAAYSVGLLNWSNKGYHKLSVSANELMTSNLSFKTGNSRLYTIWLAGANVLQRAKAYAAGYGLGHDFILSNRISVSAEITARYLYLGRESDLNLPVRFEPALQVKLFEPLAVFVAPAYTVMYSNAGPPVAGFKETVLPERYKSFSSSAKGWMGWSAGVILF